MPPPDRFAELRGFQTLKNGPVPTQIGTVLSELIALKGLVQSEGQAQLRAIWSAVAGEKIASQTRVLGIQRAVLQIGVANNALLSELAGFHKQELLEKLRTEHPHLKVKNLKFCLKTGPV